MNFIILGIVRLLKGSTKCNKIEFNIVKEYDNGVRVGIIKNSGEIGTIIPDNSM